MPETAHDDHYISDGKGGTILVSSTPRTVSDAEIERRDAPANLRLAIAALTAWQDDALDAAALTALSAAQRIARQAQIETRVATLARIVRRMLVVQGLD